MADTETLEQTDQSGEGGARKKRGRLVAGSIVLGIMLVEAVVIFFLVKTYVAPPKEAQAQVEGLDPHAGRKAPVFTEVQVAQFRAQNDRSQRQTVYDMTVTVVVGSDRLAAVREVIEQRKDTIRDRFTRVVRGMDPTRFLEPDLATLRDHFRNELNQLLGDKDAVAEVLIPSIIALGER